MRAEVRIVEGEIHLPWRQASLRDKAIEIARQISTDHDVKGILLTGSVARGPVTLSSDLDLHVIVTDSFHSDLPEWRFNEDATIENLHTVAESLLSRGLRLINRDSEIARWFYETKLGDEFYGYELLFCCPACSLDDSLSILLAARIRPEVVAHLTELYAIESRRCALLALQAARAGAAMDSQQEMRRAVQLALIASLVRKHWIIRGSKKRIEIAKSFMPDSVVEQILEAASDIVGLSDISKNVAKSICESRLALRKTLLAELNSLKDSYREDTYISRRIEVAIKDHQRHNANAFDYYSMMTQEGIFQGPINHLRCLSSFPHIPQMLHSILGQMPQYPIEHFATTFQFSAALRSGWLEIADLSLSLEDCLHWCVKLERLLSNLC